MSDSKSHILGKINKLQLPEVPLPEIPGFEGSPTLRETFIQSIEANKGLIIDKSALDEFLTKVGGESPKVLSLVEAFSHLHNFDMPADAHALEQLDVAIIKAQLGVAENGAMWFEHEDLHQRALPFITAHLVVVLDEKNILPHMHAAYEAIGNKHSGFGVFIAGPSKTADIEQSLVVGAHGAKSLRVVLC